MLLMMATVNLYLYLPQSPSGEVQGLHIVIMFVLWGQPKNGRG